jgi:hypothetical protein
VEGGGLAVDADVGDAAARAGQRGGQFDSGRHADGLDGDVGPQRACEVTHHRHRVLAAVVDG